MLLVGATQPQMELYCASHSKVTMDNPVTLLKSVCMLYNHSFRTNQLLCLPSKYIAAPPWGVWSCQGLSGRFHQYISWRKGF